MDESDVVIDLAEVLQRTEWQAEQIHRVLEQIAPIECELLGDAAARIISRGGSFEAIGGGHNLSFVEIISVLSGIATICQIAFLAIVGLRRRKVSEEELAPASKTIILVTISNHPELSKLKAQVSQDALILDRILAQILADPTKKPEE